MKNPFYLLATGAITVALGGCMAPIQEGKTPLAMYANVYVLSWSDGYGLDAPTAPAVTIIDVQLAGRPDTRFVPSGAYPNLWLRPGNYEATLRCSRAQNDAFTIPLLKETAPADADGKFRFSIEYHGVTEERLKDRFNAYRVDCAIAPDGRPQFEVASVRYDYFDD